ncbi:MULTISPECIES: cupin domain-containing protein [Polymorphospora]|uniref:Cupin domain-containing protein n=1 Tax=Polymorphospora lycopeni TaxID=3140240 RepID=A0ABV5D112_9ACTN
MHVIEGAGRWVPPADGTSSRYEEHLRVPDMSLGTYRIPAGGTDGQNPHTEDEVYVVTAGRARLVTPDGAAPVGPGSVVFVPAGEEHRFVDVTEDLTVLVFFGPAEGLRGQAAT